MNVSQQLFVGTVIVKNLKIFPAHSIRIDPIITIIIMLMLIPAIITISDSISDRVVMESYLFEL